MTTDEDDDEIVRAMDEDRADEERDELDELEGTMRLRATEPALTVNVETAEATDAAGRDLIPVWLIERETLKLMTPDEFLAYDDAHTEWQSYKDAARHVRWKRAPTDPSPAA
jgi:hypothetical protein